MNSSRITTSDGISWYVEQFTPRTSAAKSAPQIVLIPSGEGDCYNLNKLGSLLADSGYQVISFDMPGFSRTEAPSESYSYVTPELIASQIKNLLGELKIPPATFFGCSSGGGAVLAMTALYPERVIAGIVHEVPFDCPPSVEDLQKKTDDEVAGDCEWFFANVFVEQTENDGRAKWDALGPEYHARLKRNYVTWIRHLVNHYEPETNELMTRENLKKRPIFMTVGSLNQSGIWDSSWDVAKRGGFEVRTDVLHCLHFPAVTVPESLRDWIMDCIGKVKP